MAENDNFYRINENGIIQYDKGLVWQTGKGAIVLNMDGCMIILTYEQICSLRITLDDIKMFDEDKFNEYYKQKGLRYLLDDYTKWYNSVKENYKKEETYKLINQYIYLNVEDED